MTRKRHHSPVFQVARSKCNQCLFSAHKIVSDTRRKRIIANCLQQGKETYFECHKATITHEHVCCKGFYDAYGERVTIIHLAQRLGCLQFIDVETLDQAGESEANQA